MYIYFESIGDNLVWYIGAGSIIGGRVVSEVVTDSSATLIPATRVVSFMARPVMSLVRAVGAILISSLQTLVSQTNHSFLTLVILCELLLLKKTA